MGNKKLVYIAAPYTIGNKEKNVLRAIIVAEMLIKKGYIPYVPFLNYFWNRFFKHPPKFWYDYDNHWLAKCDYIVRISGKSIGADKEMKLARKLKIPILKLKFKK